MHFTPLAISALLAPFAAAHGGVVAYTAGGKTYEVARTNSGAQRLRATPVQGPQRPWLYLDPVRKSSSPNMACNTPGTPVKASMTVAAGSSVKAQWSKWPHNGGPVSVWMIECGGDCASFTPSPSAQWFKIYHDGPTAATKLIKAGNSLTVTIPASLKAGDYLMRHEIINLARPPAEYYPECAQLKVTGSGTAVPGAAVRSTFAGAYKESLPELTQSWEQWKSKASSYRNPGPAPWTGA